MAEHYSSNRITWPSTQNLPANHQIYSPGFLPSRSLNNAHEYLNHGPNNVSKTGETPKNIQLYDDATKISANHDKFQSQMIPSETPKKESFENIQNYKTRSSSYQKGSASLKQQLQKVPAVLKPYSDKITYNQRISHTRSGHAQFSQSPGTFDAKHPYSQKSLINTAETSQNDVPNLLHVTQRPYMPQKNDQVQHHQQQQLHKQANNGQSLPRTIAVPELPNQAPDRLHQDSSKDLPVIETLTKNTNLRIDTTFLPRPMVPTEPSEQIGGRHYITTQYSVSPPVFEHCTVIDRGKASCRFLRSSLNQIPNSASTLTTSALPFVVHVQPFPVLGAYEVPPPVIDMYSWENTASATDQPIRCSRCHAYASCYMTFQKDSSVVCNFCDFTFELPKEYNQYLLNSAHLLQQNSSDTSNIAHTLTRGTVDYVAPQSILNAENLDSKPCDPLGQRSVVLPPAVCFVVDTSISAIRNEFVLTALGSIEYSISTVCCPETQISIITYDDVIRFYKLEPSLASKTQVYVVPDVDDPFCPESPTSLFLKIMENKEYLLEYVQLLRQKYSEEINTLKVSEGPVYIKQSCGGAAIKAAVELFQKRGGPGTIKAFFSSYPDKGIGSWPRGKSQHLHELNLGNQALPPELNPYYASTLEACIKHSICVDCYISPLQKRHVNVACLSLIARQTGGNCFYYSNFNYLSDFSKLCADVATTLILPAGHNCVLKLRCSRGIGVSRVFSGLTLNSFHLSFQEKDPSIVRLPRIDSQLTLLFQLEHEGQIPKNAQNVYIQCACLHTTVDGFRRLRIMTLALPITQLLSTCFRYGEIEPMLCYFTRKYVSQYATTRKTEWKNQLIQELIEILFSYRLNCAPNAASGQLILPEAFKTLPVYILGLFKHTAFRASQEAMITDEREAYFVQFMSLPLERLIAKLYPRLYALHRSILTVDIEKLKRIGSVCPNGIDMYLPPVLPCCGEKITADGIFLLDNGESFILYVGTKVDPTIIQETFGQINSAEASHSLQPSQLENLPGVMGETINKTIMQLRKDKGLHFPWQPVELIFGKTPAESQLLWNLVEDRIGSEEGYVGFLCYLHKSVHKKMDDA